MSRETEPKVVAIINDCRDPNAVARQQMMVGNLFDANQTFVGVDSELEASGNLVDLLDISNGRPNIILVNKAPRNGSARQHKNGTPFGFFWHGETLVVSSVDGLALSLPKKLGLTAVVRELDIESTVDDVLEQTGEADEPGLRDKIIDTQYRSLEYVPRVARALWNRANIQSELKSLDHVPNANLRGWGVDNFGNVKTTALPGDIGFDPEQGDGFRITTALGELSCYRQLRSVPDGELAVTVGSSGFGKDRFLEVVVQGGSAHDRFVQADPGFKLSETNLFTPAS
ncbi:MAG: hypothetical protein JWO47_874 [Candidatus Saccharibacteria bacterium]|nr:hypothetical protein [Candidatus Saccharibacteria bacterium]